jgi:hypothetical protein
LLKEMSTHPPRAVLKLEAGANIGAGIGQMLGDHHPSAIIVRLELIAALKRP